ncbi:pre-peptidase [Ulvibacter sp. MAR_2010_11]|nr:pre-peptidase [Ulvibacter sp. MAR_2010_11]
MLLCCLALGITASCSKDTTTEVQEQENFKFNSEIEQSIIDKAGAEAGAKIIENLNSPARFAITYDGQLCPDEVNYGEAIYRGFADLNDADFWYFNGNAGDVVSIQVDRVSCEMDPVFYLYEGSGDTTSLTLIGSADDNNGQACAPACFSYADPLLSGFVLPSSGVYTIAVWDFIGGACTSGLQAYSIVVSGSFCDADGDGCNDDVDPHPNSNMDATVNIDGCDSGVANVFIGCSTMNDLIGDCAAAAANHGDFVSCVAHLTNEWKAAGLISGRDKGRIQSCAGQSNIP